MFYFKYLDACEQSQEQEYTVVTSSDFLYQRKQIVSRVGSPETNKPEARSDLEKASFVRKRVERRLATNANAMIFLIAPNVFFLTATYWARR